MSVFVPPLKPAVIREHAESLRKKFGSGRLPFEDLPYFDIVYFLDVELATAYRGFRLEVRDDAELPGFEGYTERGERPHIIIAESIMDRARRGDGAARGTLAHELGHFFLHQNLSLARMQSGGIEPEYSSEHQAELFAVELLCPVAWTMPTDQPKDLQMRFGIDEQRAVQRYNQLKQEGVIEVAWREPDPTQMTMDLGIPQM